MLELDTHHFDAAVIGVSLPDGDGIRLVRPLLERRPLCKSIVVAQSCAPEIPVRALREGAQSFLPWPCGPSALRHAVVETMAASRHWRERLGQRPETGGLPAESAGADVGSSAVSVNLAEMVARLRYLADLTPMQTIVVWRLLWGDGNERIAALLGVTKRTVKYHVNQVLQRTGARSRGDVLRVLLEDCGVVDPWDGMDEVSR
jgi:DNA-binding NarL/FixJ family response regulator